MGNLICDCINKQKYINFQDKKGITALMCAIIYEDLCARPYIMHDGFYRDKNYVNARKSYANFDYLKYGWLKEQVALFYPNSHSYFEIAYLLIKAGAKLDLKNNDGWTALMYVSDVLSLLHRNEILVYSLIEGGANLDLQNNNGYTALMIASKRTTKEFYPSKFYPDGTLEHDKKQAFAIIKLLVIKGANIYLKNLHGTTAYELGDEAVKKFLNNFVMLKVWKIREFSKNNMKNAFSIYNVAVNTYLFLQPK